jgi:phospholipid/cholesterol/gamma-HCH transport system permease protein
VIGAWIIGVKLIGIDDGAFWSQMQANVDVRIDVLNGLVKSIVFGTSVGLISVFEGYFAAPTAEGIATATTRTVVISSLSVLLLDLLLTVMMFRGLS